jgi:regulator of sigma E protease
MSVLLLILGLVLFVSLVVVHELGHFIVARRNGVDVEEFGIGFPPRAWGKKLKNGVLFSLNWLPLGGFVKLKGEHDEDKEPGTYGAARLKSKVKIIMAGVVMNLVVAFVLLTVLAWFGTPQIVDNQFKVASDTKVIKNDVLIGYVEPGSPAEKAGLQVRDKLVSLAPADMVVCLSTDCPSLETTITADDQLPNVTKQFAGKSAALTFERSGEVKVVEVQLRSTGEVEASKQTNDPKGYLGISPTEYTLTRATWSAPIVAAGEMVQITTLTFQGIGHALGSLLTGNAGEASRQVAGPVGIFVLLKDGSLLGYQFVLLIIALISLTLAIMNALPIPALDGGRLFVTLLFRALKKPLTKKTEDLIHGTGFAILMLLFVLITVVDIRRFF